MKEKSVEFFSLKNKKQNVENNKHMNQILLVKPDNKLHKKFFKLQFVLSILVLVFLGFYSVQKWKQEQEMHKVSQVVNQAFELETVYQAQKTVIEEKLAQNKYFGKITIPKIELEYTIFNECNDELLKILPCKFYGADFNEKGNICIAGHNYNDTRFFSKLDKLSKGDSIYLGDLNGHNYQYMVYDKYKVEANDFECLKPIKKYDLTLITCDNTNGKRLIVRASRT